MKVTHKYYPENKETEMKKKVDYEVNPTLIHVFNFERMHLATSGAHKGGQVCLSNYTDVTYGDFTYGDFAYGDFAYGDMFTNRKRDPDGSGCFAGATKILTPEGTVELQLLNNGDLVLSWNMASGEFVERRIQKVIEHKPCSVYSLSYGSRHEPVVLNLSHSLLTGKGWKRVGELGRNDRLVVAQDNTVLLARISDIQNLDRKEPVYNLRTEGEHTFIAGGLVAHNFSYFRGARSLAYQVMERSASLFRQDRSPKIQPT